MPSADRLIVELSKWVEKAEHDFTAAVQILKLGAEAPMDTICFHVQQCVEKYFKAILVANGVYFPKTHSITKLWLLLPEATRPYLADEVQARLTAYATVERYPGDEEPISLAEARKSLAVARRIRRESRRLLPRAACRRRAK